MVLEAIRYADGHLSILDQLALPHRETWERVQDAGDAWRAIRAMKVRGAPAIAIVAALSVAVELLFITRDRAIYTNTRINADTGINISNGKGMRDLIVSRLEYLVTSRPTAVNLGDAAAKLTAVVDKAAAAVESQSSADSGGVQVMRAYVAAAERMLADDVSDNRHIGEHGARWILEKRGATGKAISVMTHCNTGSLATAGYGTALGIVRALHATSNGGGGEGESRLAHVYYGETRPYNQGSRLTGYELLHDGIPCTLVTDSMAGALMAQKGPSGQTHVGKVNGSEPSAAAGGDGGQAAPLVAVVVGADRVAANGDTANKIGTYALAVLARYHGVAFVVAAPRTTIDLKTGSGSEIVIEERKQREVTVVKGPTVVDPDGVDVDVEEVMEVSIAPSATQAWNPAFDVTPAELIDAIVTEVGVAEKKDGAFDLRRLFDVDKHN